jgi:hypothetical protein
LTIRGGERRLSGDPVDGAVRAFHESVLTLDAVLELVVFANSRHSARVCAGVPTVLIGRLTAVFRVVVPIAAVVPVAVAVVAVTVTVVPVPITLVRGIGGARRCSETQAEKKKDGA